MSLNPTSGHDPALPKDGHTLWGDAVEVEALFSGFCEILINGNEDARRALLPMADDLLRRIKSLAEDLDHGQ